MKLCACNLPEGKVVRILKGQVMAKVKIGLGGQCVTSLITVDAADSRTASPAHFTIILSRGRRSRISWSQQSWR
ncbi:MAG: hypothetical protein OEL53_00040 [Rhodospirillales bacterium]|nr:hypothetical protein [Rhodospirillales bacterium]